MGLPLLRGRLTRFRPTYSICALFWIAVACPLSLSAEDAVTLDGQQIYQNQCASCHGENGAGADAPALEGDLSVAQLAAVIRETMPEDDPGTLSGDEANAVAAYVHDAFYSAIARARNQPARIELARLTVQQYRLAVADLIGSFGRRPELTDARGLTGEYFKSREPGRRDARVAERIDPAVDFDFEDQAPVDGIEDPRAFSIRWGGALLAPDTGEYEFIVETDHAARLWVNERRTPLIDAWVKSGDDTVYKGTVFLVGGQVYPIRLEFTKAKQGVDDSEQLAKAENRPPVPHASVKLSWDRPRGVVETIPARYLAPIDAPEVFVSSTPFPPDDRSYGWVRGTTISPAWDEATTTSAIEAAAHVAERLERLAKVAPDDDQREAKLREFCGKFVERAFRQPLSDEVRATYVDRQFEESPDPETAVRRVVLLTLKSPRFLYREVEGAGDDLDVASRLSVGLWNTIPDQDLRRAARKGELNSDEDVRRHAERMLSDHRGHAKLHEFLLSWLNAEVAADLGKNVNEYPGFDQQTMHELRTSLELFLDEILLSKGADFRRLFLEEEVYLNGRLVRLYGADAEPAPQFAKVRLDDGKRAGVLTHPYMMAKLAHGAQSSPIHRGVFLTRGMLGRTLRPPQEAFAPLSPDLHPDLTTRERVALQTSPAECMTCHRTINPLGFTLERFDGLGKYRDLDAGKEIDDRSEIRGRDGSMVMFEGSRSLADFLVNSDECHRAFVEHLFHYLVQQPAEAYGPGMIDGLTRKFVESEFNIRQLAVEIMVATARVGRQTDATAQN